MAAAGEPLLPSLSTVDQRLRIDAAKPRAEVRLDGKFVIYSNDESLTPTDLALGYKQRQRVEEAWRTLKSMLLPGLGCGPLDEPAGSADHLLSLRHEPVLQRLALLTSAK